MNTVGGRICLASDKYKEAEAKMTEVEILLSPEYTDMALIPKMYEIFKSVCPEKYSVYKRRYIFSLIMIMLYSPKSIVRGSLIDYLAFEVAITVGYKSQSTVGKSIKSMWTKYVLYPQFKKDIDTIIEEIRKKI